MDFESVVFSCVESESEALTDLSRQIWARPEIRFEEIFAHSLLTSFLESKGFTVQRNYVLPTAFKAEFSNCSENEGVTVALICEYDALPGIGHACGHNLIAEVGVGAALAIKAVLQNCPSILGKVVVFGTPAEEYGGGKIAMLEEDAFKGIDLSILAHPDALNMSAPGFSCCHSFNAVFTGKSSHAGFAPWDGRNALDAAVSAYVNIGLLRQQIQPNRKINVIISDGGTAVNVIPQRASLEILLRTTLTSDFPKLRDQVMKCIKAGAEATSCELQIEERIHSNYQHVRQNRVIESRYAHHAKLAGIEFVKNSVIGPSTDYGNVSALHPCLHPVFSIGTEARPHTVEFQVAAGTSKAESCVKKVILVLAFTMIDFLVSPELVLEAKKAFQDTVS